MLVVFFPMPCVAGDLRLDVVAEEQINHDRKKIVLLTVIIRDDRIPNEVDLQREGGKLSKREHSADEVRIRGFLPRQDMNGLPYWSAGFQKKKVIYSAILESSVEGTDLEGKGPGQKIRSSLSDDQESLLDAAR